MHENEPVRAANWQNARRAPEALEDAVNRLLGLTRPGKPVFPGVTAHMRVHAYDHSRDPSNPVDHL